MKLINDDAFKVMEKMIANNEKVDVIISDPPYGILKNHPNDGFKKHNLDWDDEIDWDYFWELVLKIVKPNGNIILFNKMPSAIDMVYPAKVYLLNRIVWIKSNHSNPYNIKTNPYSYTEDIYTFRNNIGIDINGKPKNNNETFLEIRNYSYRLKKEWIKKSPSKISKEIGNSKCEIFLRDKVKHFFSLPTEENYNKLVKFYNIEQWSGYKPYSELEKYMSKITFNGKIKDYLEFEKDKNNQHPTQKPLNLMKLLVKTYSNENDIVFDPFMGSGTTGVACKNLNRNFIGIELNEKYFQIAKERIESD